MTYPNDPNYDPEQRPEQGRPSDYPGYGDHSEGGSYAPPQYGSQPPSYGGQAYGEQQPSYGAPQYGGDAYGGQQQSGGYGNYSSYPGYGGGYGGGYGMPPQQLPKGMAIAALVLGILSLLGSWIPVGGYLCIILGLVAVILGIIAVRKAARGQAGGRGMAIAGIAVGALGLLLSVAFSIFWTWAFNTVAQCTGITDPQRMQQCIEQQTPGQQQQLGLGDRVVIQK